MEELYRQTIKDQQQEEREQWLPERRQRTEWEYFQKTILERWRVVLCFVSREHPTHFSVRRRQAEELPGR